MTLSEIETKLKLANKRIQELERSQRMLLSRLTSAQTELDSAKGQLDEMRIKLESKQRKKTVVLEPENNE